jgi:hypothetical protein
MTLRFVAFDSRRSSPSWRARRSTSWPPFGERRLEDITEQRGLLSASAQDSNLGTCGLEDCYLQVFLAC